MQHPELYKTMHGTCRCSAHPPVPLSIPPLPMPKCRKIFYTYIFYALFIFHLYLYILTAFTNDQTKREMGPLTKITDVFFK